MIAISSRFGDALGRSGNVLATPIAALEQTGQRLGALLDAQRQTVAGLERMTATVSDLETRVASHFEAAALRAADIQQAALQKLAAAQDAACDAIVGEIRSGWGRKARGEFEQTVERRLSATVAGLEGTAERQLRAMQRITAFLVLAMALRPGPCS